MADKYETGRFDSLISDSSVRLFGRVMWDITLRKFEDDRNDAYGDELDPYPKIGPVPNRLAGNQFLIQQLKHPLAQLARIYSFSYQNEMFELSKPAIFLVHGDGNLIEHDKDDDGTGRLLKKTPGYPEKTGMVGQQGSFAPLIYMWIYDRADFTVRLDMETGTLERVLLEVELGSAIDTGSMQAGRTDPPPPPPPRRRRRRWRNDED